MKGSVAQSSGAHHQSLAFSSTPSPQHCHRNTVATGRHYAQHLVEVTALRVASLLVPWPTVLRFHGMLYFEDIIFIASLTEIIP